MQLSEAILKGAKLRPQTTTKCFKRSDDKQTVSSCVLGAAYEATFGFDNEHTELSTLEVIEMLKKEYPILSLSRFLANELFTLNDKGQSRESIAALVKEIEMEFLKNKK